MSSLLGWALPPGGDLDAVHEHVGLVLVEQLGAFVSLLVIPKLVDLWWFVSEDVKWKFTQLNVVPATVLLRVSLSR